MPKLIKIVNTFKFNQLHAKISTPTGTPVPDEKAKELSSIVHPCFTPSTNIDEPIDLMESKLQTDWNVQSSKWVIPQFTVMGL